MSINELNSLKKTKICFELIEIYKFKKEKVINNQVKRKEATNS
jgi:hypothetical protein